MVFCNMVKKTKNGYDVGHNPYFNRWFSAILSVDEIINQLKSHNPYFNRWFSAIWLKVPVLPYSIGHNPYFNRWFSAILISDNGVIL